VAKLSIGGALKQILLIKTISLEICDVIRNLFKILMNLRSFWHMTCFNS
jgi:hypothetical protein